MNLKEIKDLIKFVSSTGVSEVAIEDKGFKLNIVKSNGEVKSSYVASLPPQVAVVPPTSAPIPSLPDSVKEKENNHTEIKSPMIGTFYRKPAPDKEAFVNVGDVVSKDSVICTIEAMKLFNEVEAEISGTIIKCLVEDGSPVEFDQPLFLIEVS